MKTSRSLTLAAALGLTSLFIHAADEAAPAVQPGTTPVTSLSSSAAAQAATWDDIKTKTYDQRGEFLAGLKKLESQIDSQIAELNAKRAKMKTNTTDWDFAMKSLNDARSYLKSMSTEINDSTVDTWDGEKEKVQRAWQSTQEAYDRVKTTTTQS